MSEELTAVPGDCSKLPNTDGFSAIDVVVFRDRGVLTNIETWISFCQVGEVAFTSFGEASDPVASPDF